MQVSRYVGKSEIFSHRREREIFIGRVRVLRILSLVLIFLLSARVVYLQLYQHDSFNTAAEANRLELQPLMPQRGEIVDYNGSRLAVNRVVRSVFYAADQLNRKPETLIHLATLLDMDDHELARLRKRVARTIADRQHGAMLIKSDINDRQEAALMVRSHRLPGLRMQNSLERYYPYGESFSHVIGYLGPITQESLDNPDFDRSRYLATRQMGRVGAERHYEDLLQGYPGWEKVEVDVHGKVNRTVSSSPAKPGKLLRLGLDAQLQGLTGNLLGDRRGAVVAIEPASGRLLVLLSSPGYDPNLFIRGIDTRSYNYLLTRGDLPFFARYSRGLYAPASTIKPFYAIGLLKRGMISPEKYIIDKGYFQIDGDDRLYRNWQRGGHGKVDLDRAIRISNDTFFYNLADELGHQPFVESLHEFGFGGPVSLDVPGEKPGVVPTPEWKLANLQSRWYSGDTLNMSIGQGYLLATPLQMAAATATIANHGKPVPPRLLMGVDNKPVHSWSSQLEQQDISADAAVWDRIIKDMVDVTINPEGTAFRVGENLPYKLAGKTGTAQLFSLEIDQTYRASDVEKRLRDNALFVGFAPADNPRIAIAVVIENGGSGSSNAAPLAAQIIDAHLRQNFAGLFRP